MPIAFHVAVLVDAGHALWFHLREPKVAGQSLMPETGSSGDVLSLSLRLSL